MAAMSRRREHSSRRSTPWSIVLGMAFAVGAVLATVGLARVVDPNALWKIVHGQCVPNQMEHNNPAPCAAVDISVGPDKGSAVLKDDFGRTQFLLIATARISGIESPEILDAAAPNYWQDAWNARTFVQARAPAKLSRDDIGLAINAESARTQNQLHIHIDCIRPAVRDALRAAQAGIRDSWSKIALLGQDFSVRRIDQPEFGIINPFKLVARELVSGDAGMAAETIVLVGASFGGDRDGFYLLAQKVEPGTANRGHGEDLLDHACAVAGKG